MSSTTNDGNSEEATPLAYAEDAERLGLPTGTYAEDAKALGQPIGVYGVSKYGACRSGAPGERPEIETAHQIESVET